MVNAEDHACAEEVGISVGKSCVIIVGLIPKALAGNSDTLSSDLADNSLHDDLVSRDGKCLDLLLNLANDSLNLGLCLGLIVLFVLEVLSDDCLNDIADFGRVESECIV